MARGLHILLIEDSDDDALLFARGVESLSVRVTRVPDAMKAIHRLSGEDALPDVILLDLDLPGMTAREFLDRVDQSPCLQKIPIFIYTGSDVVEEGLKSAARKVFFKSSNLFEIQAMVQEVCGLVPGQ
jgi:CheY-like chemotaxis protein